MSEVQPAGLLCYTGCLNGDTSYFFLTSYSSVFANLVRNKLFIY